MRLGLFRFLRPVNGTGLLSILHALRVENATDDMVADAREVFHAAAMHQHHRVFLQIMAFAANIGRDFGAIGQTNASHLAESRIRFLGRSGGDFHAHAALLGIAVGHGDFTRVEGVESVLQGRRLAFDLLVFPRFSDELVNSGHGGMNWG